MSKTRKYQGLPENGTVETPFGTMAVRFMFDGDNPTITLDGSGDGAFITVNGVRISASLTLTDYGDGFEQRRDENGGTRHALYASRMWDESRSCLGGRAFDVSDAAERKIRDTLPAVANEWAKGRDGLFAIARRVTVNNDIVRLQDDLDAGETRVAELRAEISAATERYAAIR